MCDNDGKNGTQLRLDAFQIPKVVTLRVVHLSMAWLPWQPCHPSFGGPKRPSFGGVSGLGFPHWTEKRPALLVSSREAHQFRPNDH